MTHAPAPQIDLTNCDREPIHLLGRVQSYGALVAVSPDWTIRHASENIATLFGLPPDQVLGRALTELVTPDGFDRIRSNLHGFDARDTCLRLFNVALARDGRAFDLSVHESGGNLILEFEPKGAQSGRDVMTEVYPLIRRIRADGDLARLARDAARALRMLSGFDSVMVYQFQPDQSGRVIAEDRSDGQRRYMGLRFPASDIPVQARALYTRNLLRLIADVDDPGAAILPPRSTAEGPLDLTMSVTRAVSPIHIEYLRNMGVGASMSVSILKDGKLWGLFACHHDTPRYIDYERRTAVEMFGHLFSFELARFAQAGRAEAEQDASRLQTRLMAQMADGRALSDSLLAVSREIDRVIPHDGMILYSEERFHATGATPTEEEFRALMRVLDRTVGNEAFATAHLAGLLPDAADYAARTAGIIAIPVSRRPRDYLLLCRRQVAATVDWAGDPAKPATIGPNGTRLSPRKSFEVWSETVSGRAEPWSEASLHAAELLRTVLLEIFLKVTDAAAIDRKRAQEQQDLLISELNHRVRNILNLMRGLVMQSKRGAATLADYTESLDGRIHALARAHDQLTAEHWEPISLRTLIGYEFAAYAHAQHARVVISGGDVMIAPSAYTTLALVLHEMATNSVKYGALCDQTGRVEITLSRDAHGGLLMHWAERGGPPVQPPSRQGFGSRIIEASIPHELKGDAEVSYLLTGLEARFRIPPGYVSEAPESAPLLDISDAASSVPAGRGVDGATALVLEDAMIIAMDVAAMLEEMGAAEVRIAASVTQALQLIERALPDFAVLDVNLGNEQSLAVAERLAAAGIPFLLTTGYGETGELVAAYPPCVIVQKPVSTTALETGLQRLFDADR